MFARCTFLLVSKILSFAENAPSSPRDIKATAIDDHSVLVTCDLSSFKSTPLVGMSVHYYLTSGSEYTSLLSTIIISSHIERGKLYVFVNVAGLQLKVSLSVSLMVNVHMYLNKYIR